MRSLLFIAFVFPFLYPTSAQTVDCGCEAGPVPAVWAKVNTTSIGQVDIGAAAVQRIEALHKQVVDARKRELDLQINSRLLNLEAAKRQLTTTQLLENEVGSKAKVPTDADIEAYFNANILRIESQAGRAVKQPEIKENVRTFLTEENQRQRAASFADQLRAAYGAKMFVSEASVPKSPADLQKVLATIGTVSITSADIEQMLRPLIYSTQTQVYKIRKDAADLVVNDQLLAAEAAKRNITAKSLIDAEITNKVPAVTDAQGQAFFDQNKARLNGEFAKIKPQIIEYLREQEQRKLEAAFAERLRAAARVEYFISPPVPPTYAIDIRNRPTVGPANAPITLAAFVDYQCKTCAEFHDTLHRIVRESNGRVRAALLNYPLNQHKEARKAAEAAEAAREQGKFWEYIALLYKNQADLSTPKLKEMATVVGLDRAKFDAALDSGKFAAVVEGNLGTGDQLGINGTPTIFINGRPTDAYNYADLKKAIDSVRP